ncbi:hypothetical protein [Pseudofrankia sp. BMG5.37]|uniref:hypothetical protein n=1 Tax=Pseudofrankia sp. BMG5.37 TaxID=3050035 RepID=UPI002894B63E|nr:hypothetical protein [Pseudofrankia sp. BMG5.37]MDT3446781.1 hypothetical protein [Pseudofrankia sp. BMG5.37]
MTLASAFAGPVFALASANLRLRACARRDQEQRKLVFDLAAGLRAGVGAARRARSAS